MNTRQKAEHYYTIAFGIRCERERDELAAALRDALPLLKAEAQRYHFGSDHAVVRYRRALAAVCALGAEYQPIDANGRPVSP